LPRRIILRGIREKYFERMIFGVIGIKKKLEKAKQKMKMENRTLYYFNNIKGGVNVKVFYI